MVTVIYFKIALAMRSLHMLCTSIVDGGQPGSGWWVKGSGSLIQATFFNYIRSNTIRNTQRLWHIDTNAHPHSVRCKKPTYRFRSNVDSNWKTCARENTVLVFFLRFVCIDPFGWGELLSEGLSPLSVISSSIISLSSSSDSSLVAVK